jgi:hypothetical protein
MTPTPDLLTVIRTALEECRTLIPDAQAAAVMAALGLACTPGGTHLYLSTGCLHGDHAYCQSNTGKAGAKKPAECKFCCAGCLCPCHQPAPCPRCKGHGIVPDWKVRDESWGGPTTTPCPDCNGEAAK